MHAMQAAGIGNLWVRGNHHPNRGTVVIEWRCNIHQPFHYYQMFPDEMG
jgi:hypothetical protein